jgi:hypothetical protein
MVAATAITMMILLALASVLGVVVYRAILLAVMSATANKTLQGNGRIYTSLTSAVLNLLSITLLSKVRVTLSVSLSSGLQLSRTIFFKEKTDRQTDGQADRQTDGRTVFA